MATVAQNIATIQEQSAILDSLVTQYRSAKALIDLAEMEIRKAQPNAAHETRLGRARLADFAHAQMILPPISGAKSVADLAAEAWRGVA